MKVQSLANQAVLIEPHTVCDHGLLDFLVQIIQARR